MIGPFHVGQEGRGHGTNVQQMKPIALARRQRMGRRLQTKTGKALYKKRGVLVKPVFGMIKSVRGFERFVRRGLTACSNEWKLICASHNLLKLWRSGRRIRGLAAA